MCKAERLSLFSQNILQGKSKHYLTFLFNLSIKVPFGSKNFLSILKLLRFAILSMLLTTQSLFSPFFFFIKYFLLLTSDMLFYCNSTFVATEKKIIIYAVAFYFDGISIMVNVAQFRFINIFWQQFLLCCKIFLTISFFLFLKKYVFFFSWEDVNHMLSKTFSQINIFYETYE